MLLSQTTEHKSVAISAQVADLDLTALKACPPSNLITAGIIIYRSLLGLGHK